MKISPGRKAVCLGLCGLLVWFLADAGAVRAAVEEALSFCGRTVIPSLFPALVVTSLLLSLGFAQLLSPLLEELMVPLFRVPGAGAAALVLGVMGGYPLGAAAAAQLCRQGVLSREEGLRLITFCSCGSPVFFLSVLGKIFGSARAGLWLWLIHLAAAMVTGILFRNSGKSPGNRPVSRPIAFQAQPLASAFSGAVFSGLKSILTVCGCVVFFSVLTLPVSRLEGPGAVLISGLLELFSMTRVLSPDRIGFVLASGLAGWGGLSALFQTGAVLEGSGLPLSRAALGKAVHGLTAALLAFCLSGYVLG